MADTISDIQRDEFIEKNKLTVQEYQKIEEDNSKEVLCLNCANPIADWNYRKTQFCSSWCQEVYDHYVDKGRGDKNVE